MRFLTNISRTAKRRLFFVADFLLVQICLTLGFAFRYGSWNPELVFGAWQLFPAMAVAGTLLIAAFGLPHIKLHSLEREGILRIAKAAGALSGSAILLSYLMDLTAPRSVPLIFGALFFLSSFLLRMLALRILQKLNEKDRTKIPVVIYGAGTDGHQLVVALRHAKKMQPVAFVDDDRSLEGLIVAGLPVHRPSRLPALIRRHQVRRVLLAMPSQPLSRIEALTTDVCRHGVEVRTLQQNGHTAVGNGHQLHLKRICINTLLGRSPVSLDAPEIAHTYEGRVVMVTGAGGFIGSELCRQLIQCRPARIVLFDHNEAALSQLQRELNGMASGISIITRLGSVTNSKRVSGVVKDEAVDIIIHAASYSQSHMASDNALECAHNNVFGTQVVADVAQSARIERFVLISTSVTLPPQGTFATVARIAEMIVQDRQSRSAGTRFSAVRCGSTLGPTGSLVSLFQKQIAQGGPVTVGHPEQARYFMTRTQSARLILVSCAFADGGEILELDKGEPQKVLEIAHRAITLAGHEIMDPKTGTGDIAIEFTGLRPGEQLVEPSRREDDIESEPFQNGITQVRAPCLSQIEMAAVLQKLDGCNSKDDLFDLANFVYNRLSAGPAPMADAAGAGKDP
jgi:FlaA1/EpsC-like NDP-sugar epimerase